MSFPPYQPRPQRFQFAPRFRGGFRGGRGMYRGNSDFGGEQFAEGQQQFMPTVISCPPTSKPLPVTTCFIGNIPEKCTNDVMILILQELGSVASWKRVIGANGKYQGFGFCEYNDPNATARALRILHGYRMTDKKLVVKVDEKTREILREYLEEKDEKEEVEGDEAEGGEDGRKGVKTEGGKGGLPCSEEDKQADARYIVEIDNLIKRSNPELIAVDTEEGEIGEVVKEEEQEEPYLEGKGGSIDFEDMDPSQKRKIASEITKFREQTKDATEFDHLSGDKELYEERKRKRGREKRDADDKDMSKSETKVKREPSEAASSDGEHSDAVERDRKRVKQESRESSVKYVGKSDYVRGCQKKSNSEDRRLRQLLEREICGRKVAQFGNFDEKCNRRFKLKLCKN